MPGTSHGAAYCRALQLQTTWRGITISELVTSAELRAPTAGKRLSADAQGKEKRSKGTESAELKEHSWAL